ncbi:MAG: homoserine kinase [Candidatus Latescibacterota bacterium]|jgi:homoserine kinase
MQKAEIVVPASSANLGPGFDCLGLSLSLYHRLMVTESPGEGFEVRASGEGAGRVPLDGRNWVCRAMDRVFAESGYSPGRLVVECACEIPLARGLGSSAAALLAGTAAAMLLAGESLDRDRLLQRGVVAEGHPDNVAPCVLGGFTVAVTDHDAVHCLRLEPPAGLRAVVAIPDFSLPTSRARAVLPARVELSDAAGNAARVGLLTAAIATGRLDLLAPAMVDVLHEPYRRELVPGLEEVRAAALAGGALGAALSGAGPAVLALVTGDGKAVGRAMEEAWQRQGVRARAVTLEIDRQGLQGRIEHD